MVQREDIARKRACAESRLIVAGDRRDDDTVTCWRLLPDEHFAADAARAVTAGAPQYEGPRSAAGLTAQ